MSILENKVKQKFDISILLLFAAIILGMYFCMNMVLFSFSDPKRPFTIYQYIPLFIVAITPSFIYAVFKFKYKESYTKFDIVIAIIFILILGLNIYTVIALPNGASTYGIDSTKLAGVTFDYSFSEKLYSILYSVVSLITGYILLCELPKKFRTSNHISFWFCISLIVCAVFMVYSYITQADEYASTLKNFDYAHIKVLFIDTCNCAVWLFYMMFGCFYINNKKPCIIWYIIALFLLFNIYIQKSKICLFMGAILYVAYAYFRMAYTYKKHPKRSKTGLILFSITIALIALCFFLFQNSPNNFFYKLWNQIKYEFGITKNSIEARIDIWKDVKSILDNSSWYTGLGFSIFNKVLDVYRAGATDLPHNAFLEFVGVGGYPLLAIFLGLYIYTFVVIFKIRKKNPSLFFICLITNTLYILHMMFDSNTPFLMTSTPIIDVLFIAFVCVIPAYSEYYHMKHPEDNLGLVNAPQVEKCEFAASKKYYFFLFALITTFLPVIIVKDVYQSGSYLFALLGVVFCFILEGLVFQLIEGKFNVWKWFKQVLVPYILLSVLSGGTTTLIGLLLNPAGKYSWLVLVALNICLYLLLLLCVSMFQKLFTPIINIAIKANEKVLKIELKDIQKNEHN